MPRLTDQTCVLGIIVNGVSHKIDTLDIESDQSTYDYICNVTSSGDNNGNGEFNISIVDKNLIKGIPVGNWILVEGGIIYNWGASDAYFFMLDEQGNKTKRIYSSSSSGSATGFSIEVLTRSIFTKARDIVAEYPSAQIYNEVSRFLNSSFARHLKPIKKYNGDEDLKESNENFYKGTLKPLADYIELYNNTVKILENNEDIRSKRLLDKVISECHQTLIKLAN